MRIVAAVALVALALAAPSPAPSQPRPADPGRAATGRAATETPIVLSVSGGVSLGSYQAGVNWALVTFLNRATHDPAYRAQHALLASRDPAVLDSLPRFS